jgi:hypothetical protein
VLPDNPAQIRFQARQIDQGSFWTKDTASAVLRLEWDLMRAKAASCAGDYGSAKAALRPEFS